MGKTCDICGKRPGRGHQISHSHRVTKRKWNPNLRRVHAIVDGAPRHIRVCTRCLRSGRVVKAG